LARLVQVLKGLHPAVITLEFSIYGLRYRLEKKSSLSHFLLRGLRELHVTEDLSLGTLKKLLKTIGIGGIRALLNLPFEYKGASFYSRQNGGIPLYCVDLSSYSRQLLSNTDELLDPKNLEKVIAFETVSLREAVMREYQQAETLLFNGKQSPCRPVIPVDKFWEKRERIMACRIRNIVARYAGRRIVHIGGWKHLAAEPGTLFRLLEDLAPRRTLLASL
jgi:hypothetical protein